LLIINYVKSTYFRKKNHLLIRLSDHSPGLIPYQRKEGNSIHLAFIFLTAFLAGNAIKNRIEKKEAIVPR
jgi:hypothetical protein